MRGTLFQRKRLKRSIYIYIYVLNIQKPMHLTCWRRSVCSALPSFLFDCESRVLSPTFSPSRLPFLCHLACNLFFFCPLSVVRLWKIHATRSGERRAWLASSFFVLPFCGFRIISVYIVHAALLESFRTVFYLKTRRRDSSRNGESVETLMY